MAWPLPGVVTFIVITCDKVPEKPQLSMSNTGQFGLISDYSVLAQIWHSYMCAESRQSFIFPAHSCWPLPFPSGNPSSSHRVFCTWTFWQWGSRGCNWNNELLFVVFFFESVSVMTLKVCGKQMQLYLFWWWMNWLMQTVKIHFGFAAANYTQAVN